MCVCGAICIFYWSCRQHACCTSGAPDARGSRGQWYLMWGEEPQDGKAVEKRREGERKGRRGEGCLGFHSCLVLLCWRGFELLLLYALQLSLSFSPSLSASPRRFFFLLSLSLCFSLKPCIFCTFFPFSPNSSHLCNFCCIWTVQLGTVGLAFSFKEKKNNQRNQFLLRTRQLLPLKFLYWFPRSFHINMYI